MKKVKKFNHKKKLAALLLAVAITVQGLPLSAFASTDTVTEEVIPAVETVSEQEQVSGIEEGLQLEETEEEASKVISSESEVNEENEPLTELESETSEESSQEESSQIEEAQSEQEESSAPESSQEEVSSEESSQAEHIESTENEEVSQAEETKSEVSAIEEIEFLTVDANGTLLYGGEPLYVGKGDEAIPANIDLLLQKGVSARLRAIGGADIQYHGNVTYGQSKVGNFTVNRKQAFCLQHPKATPGTGTPNNGLEPYDNDNIRRILYYGWGGPANIFGSDQSRGIVVTSLVLSKYYNGDISGTSIPGWAELDNLAQNGIVPDNDIDINGTKSNVNLTVSIMGNKQVSASGVLNAHSDNYITVNLPTGITLVNETTGSNGTGSVRVYGGQKFHLEAPLNYTGNFSSGTLKGVMQAFQPLVIKPQNSSYQDIGTADWYDDPTQTVSFSAEFKTTYGYLQIVKTADDNTPTNNTVTWCDFMALGSDGSENRYSTHSDGKTNPEQLPVYDNNGNPITYTIREYNTGGRYIQPADQTVTLTAGQTTVVNVHNSLKKADVKIKKTSENGVVAGFEFEITGNAQTQTGITDSNGEFTFKDMVIYDSNNKEIMYTAKEINVPNDYIEPQSQTFTLKENQTVELNFHNALKYGTLEIIKTSEDGNVAGLKFNVSGNGINQDDTTDTNGKLNIQNLVPGIYDITEYTPNEYVPQQTKQVTVVAGQTATVTFNNVLKKWSLNVTKVDSETSTAQGNAALAGAVYGLYNGGQLVDTYTTGADGKFTTKTYICGDNWTMKEITASQGYLLDPTVYSVGVSAGNTTIELNPTSETVTEQVIKGNVQIHKHLEGTNENSGIREPEENAVFELYLTSAGSFASAKSSEKDLLTTDKDGIAKSKDLPFGWYTAHQISGHPSYKLAPDFQVFISENGKTYVYFIANVGIFSDIKIIKKDSETGKIIPLAGTGFKVKDLSTGLFIDQLIKYPNNQFVSEFYTNSDGWLMLPEKLLKGNYELYEIQAPHGYVLDTAPIPFTVDENSTEIEVVKENKPQMGRITIEKIGEIFVSVSQNDGIYQPVYELTNLENAVYNVVAAEDIITGDGTVRAKKGDILDTITTGNDGKATTKPLYIGKYKAIEISAPNGYVLDSTPIDFEIVYTDQNEEITEISAEAYNERQKVKISLHKVMESDFLFGITGIFEVTDVEFGLYAEEEITAQDGTIIPKNGLIEVVKLSFGGKMSLKTDLPFSDFYLKEIKTNENYVLSDEKYPIKFEYQGQETAVVEIQANDGKAIENKLVRGSVQLTKLDAETFEKLSGAEFEVYKDVSGTKEFDEAAQLIGTMAEIETGIYELTALTKNGGYFVKEKTAPNGYLADENIYYFVITEDGETAVIENKIGVGFVNWQVPEIHTTATVGGEKVIVSGGKITIIDTVTHYHLNPDYEYKLVGIAMEKVKNAKFIVNGKEVPADKTFKPESPTGTIELEFTFDSNGITEDTDITIFEKLYRADVLLATHEDINDEGQTVTIKPLKGSVEGKKVDDNGKALAGAVIGLFPADTKDFSENNALMTETSKNDGSFSFTDLGYGEYLVREISAPNGYILSDETFNVSIKEDGEIIKIEIVNKKVPVTPIVKTGDNTTILTLKIVCAAAVIGMIFTALVLKRKRKTRQTESR